MEITLTQLPPLDNFLFTVLSSKIDPLLASCDPPSPPIGGYIISNNASITIEGATFVLEILRRWPFVLRQDSGSLTLPASARKLPKLEVHRLI